ncbi:MAG TPA: DHA2 family efflux MFS transporter permease subunit [Devosia sp.]|jgi:DHA2 family multidrug resistance protein|nr:DHA2 family efflux MFS transporter permease subunit [Devosia sp.]
MADTTAGTIAAAAQSSSMPTRRIIAFFFMVVGMFMAILDIQVVSASLSEIQAGLSAGSDEIAWVQTSYLIAEVIMIPLSGTLARILSTRVLFTIAAAGFTAASALCATATSIDQMIVYRAIQGFIGGGMIPSVFAAAFTIFPRDKRAIVSPIIGLTATLAPTIGPTVGGYLTSTLSWHWLFLINVFPGIIVAAMAWLLIDFDKPEKGLFAKFDWIGLVGLAAFLGSMEYVLEEGPGHDWLNDQSVMIFTVVMVLGGILFFWRALRVEFPVVDLSAVRDVNFSVGSIFSFVLGIGLYGLTYIYPLFLGRIRGYDSMMIGETLFVSGLAMFLTAPIAGVLSNKMDLRVMLMFGFILFAAGTWSATQITDDWSFAELLVPQILRGVGLMLCMVPINNLALGTLPPQKLKGASGLFNLTRNLGGAVGLALINTVLSNRTVLHVERLSEGINLGNPATVAQYNSMSANDTANGLDGATAAIQQLGQMVQKQAYVLSFIDVFMLLTLLFGLLALGALLMNKPAPAPAGAGGGH